LEKRDGKKKQLFHFVTISPVEIIVSDPLDSEQKGSSRLYETIQRNGCIQTDSKLLDLPHMVATKKPLFLSHISELIPTIAQIFCSSHFL